MTQFAATFSNGETITRNSDHAYAFAWAVIRIADGVVETSGFSADRINAAKAAQSRMWSPISARDRKNPAIRRFQADLAKKRGQTLAEFYQAFDADVAKHNAARRIEIVPVN